MKKIILIGAIAGIFLTSCARVFPTGALYENVSLPRSYSTVSGIKVGKSSCVNIMGMVLVGDASLMAAKRNGNISAISTHDENTQMILGGLITRTTTIITGQ